MNFFPNLIFHTKFARVLHTRYEILKSSVYLKQISRQFYRSPDSYWQSVVRVWFDHGQVVSGSPNRSLDFQNFKLKFFIKSFGTLQWFAHIHYNYMIYSLLVSETVCWVRTPSISMISKLLEFFTRRTAWNEKFEATVSKQ